jgi:hypothetical protein
VAPITSSPLAPVTSSPGRKDLLIPHQSSKKKKVFWSDQPPRPSSFNWPSTPQFSQPSKFAPVGRAPRAQVKKRTRYHEYARVVVGYIPITTLISKPRIC